MYRIKIVNLDGSLVKMITAVTNENPEYRKQQLEKEYPGRRVIIMKASKAKSV